MAVEDLDEAVGTYERLFGGRLEHRGTLEDQGVEAVSMRLGESRVELMGSLGEESPVGKFLAKRGPGMHHVAYEVEDITASLRQLRDDSIELIDAEPRTGGHGLLIAFIHPRAANGVLTELVQVPA